MKITTTSVRKITPPDSGYSLHFDSELKGFGIRVTSAGHKSYIAEARVNGKKRRVTIGKHGVITPDEARKKARKALVKMADGIDPPSEARRDKALSVTLAEVTEAYLENRRTRAGLPLKDRTKGDIRYHLKSSFGDWRDRPVVDITREMISKRYAKHCKSSVAQANQSMRVLGAILNYAAASYRTPEGERIIADNPVTVLREANLIREVKPKKSMVPLDRIGEWWSAVQAMRNDPALTTASKSSADLVAVLALTGLRLGEARSIRWDHVDTDEGSLRLTDTKSRTDITLPLADLVVDILKDRRNRSEWVFPARSGGGCLKDCRGQLKILSEQTGIAVTAHDLRRSFRAVAAKCGIELWRTKALMNHKQTQDVTLHSYTDLSDVRYLRDEANRIAQYFQDQRRVFESDNVVSMERRA